MTVSDPAGVAPCTDRSLRSVVLQDWAANRGSTKSQVVMAAFRLAHHWDQGDSRVPGPVRKLGVLGYKVLTTWVLGVEIPPETSIGPGLVLKHPQAIVVNGQSRIGARCMLRACTTLGNLVERDGAETASPVLGDDVELGVGVIVIGPIHVGDRARIGAGAVVITDVPAGAVAVGNPARVLPAADAT
ncbi:MAG: serine acetyltransferase [Acidimicrobiia bacterium]|nr:serine acetyltransferase [Acidimicrobiia bacterium]